MEMDALTKFAPSYFDYMRQGVADQVSGPAISREGCAKDGVAQRPTALAKIYGFFKIGYRNTTTGKVMRMNVLLMENLFYERRFERVGHVERFDKSEARLTSRPSRYTI
jgi:1-phosphatidylinositol-3-phosphate 5-kinase